VGTNKRQAANDDVIEGEYVEIKEEIININEHPEKK
jgi:hypothetical protein